jgi:type IV secretion system protein VirB11
VSAHPAEPALRYLLQPIAAVMAHPALTDLHVNAPGHAFADVGRGLEPVPVPWALHDLEDIAILSAAFSGQRVTAEVPLVSALWPDGERVQVIRAPAVAPGYLSLSIRKPGATVPTHADMAARGAYAETRAAVPVIRVMDADLDRLHAEGRWEEFLPMAVRAGLSMVFSGVMGSGKTFQLRAALAALPIDQRLVSIEDTRELLGLPQRNYVPLLYSKGGQGSSSVTAGELVEASLRMAPKTLAIQELRDGSALAFFDALTTGHQVLTTVHAPSAEKVPGRIRRLVKRNPLAHTMDDQDVEHELRQNIGVIVHCVQDGMARWRVQQVLYRPQEGPSRGCDDAPA